MRPLSLSITNSLKMLNDPNDFMTMADSAGASSAIHLNVGSLELALSMTGLTCTTVDGRESTPIRSASSRSTLELRRAKLPIMVIVAGTQVAAPCHIVGDLTECFITGLSACSHLVRKYEVLLLVFVEGPHPLVKQRHDPLCFHPRSQYLSQACCAGPTPALDCGA